METVRSEGFAKQLDMRTEPIRIILVGKTGSGKSTLGNALDNRMFKVGRGLRSDTNCDWKTGTDLVGETITIILLGKTGSGKSTLGNVLKGGCDWKTGTHLNGRTLLETNWRQEHDTGKLDKTAPGNRIDRVNKGVTEEGEKMTSRGIDPKLNSQFKDTGDGIPGRSANHHRLIVLLSISPPFRKVGLYTHRMDLHIGDLQLLNESFQKTYGISGKICASTVVSISGDATEDIKLQARFQLTGEDKEYWEHCLTGDGQLALPEKQRLFLSQLIHQLSTTGSCMPVLVQWCVETTDGLPHDLQATVQLFNITNMANSAIASLSQEDQLVSITAEVPA